MKTSIASIQDYCAFAGPYFVVPAKAGTQSPGMNNCLVYHPLRRVEPWTPLGDRSLRRGLLVPNCLACVVAS